MAFPQYTPDTDGALFTTYEEIAQEMSTKGFRLRTDDLRSTDKNYDNNNSSDLSETNYIATICQRVTSEVCSYLCPRYNADDLAPLPRIREIATYWACYKLSKRRGNPALYEEEYLDAQNDLELYRSGDRYLDVPSNGPRAYMQSYVLDTRFNRTQLRVNQYATTKVLSSQNTLLYTPFWWL